MDEELPADASTLIYIAKADAFQEIQRCVSTILVPSSVWREAVEEGEGIGAVEVPRIRKAEQAGSLRLAELAEAEAALAAAIAGEHRLGSGESEALALGKPIGQAIVDEGRATR